MDFLSIFGILFGLLAIILGQFLEGGHIGSLINGPAFIIVFGGTLGAVMVETPRYIFIRAIHMLPLLIKPSAINFELEIRELWNWSNVARKQGLLGLEVILENEHDSFKRKGLSLLIDGSEPKTIRQALEIDLDSKIQNQLLAAKVYEGMGGYSPTIGIIGAVLGLIQVMSNLSDPSKLGAGIAIAFVATIYGVGFANIIFLPVSNKLQRMVLEYAKKDHIFIEGVAAIADGEHPNVTRLKLQGYK